MISRKRGVSAIIRAKNEAHIIGRCLDLIYPVFDEIIVVDNNSADQTQKVVLDIEKTHSKGKIKLHTYPFDLSRIGPENAATDDKSIHSFVYFSNWALKHASYAYLFKWDADMLLHPDSATDLRLYLDSLSPYWPIWGSFKLQTIYVSDDGVYAPEDDVNCETHLAPNRSDVFFAKNGYFELLTKNCLAKHKTFDCFRIYEHKDLRRDEFAHWSTDHFVTERKRREADYFARIKGKKGIEGIRQLSSECRSEIGLE
ncbi:glycosyltransferase [Ectothiorhodospira marina]|uniref:Glycosyl transferase family 2 n=1 Tax=Ectothiorhodospira marina TaxID=1396821 RepID=A0A1H7IB22_9GAMM|nr:glycosyltransferase [Ectothiorhodospira marina]SEK59743.1 Glycosyl transferase family 2 [Ectothiorhodospira marina]